MIFAIRQTHLFFNLFIRNKKHHVFSFLRNECKTLIWIFDNGECKIRPEWSAAFWSSFDYDPKILHGLQVKDFAVCRCFVAFLKCIRKCNSNVDHDFKIWNLIDRKYQKHCALIVCVILCLSTTWSSIQHSTLQSFTILQTTKKYKLFFVFTVTELHSLQKYKNRNRTTVHKSTHPRSVLRK